MIICSKCVLPNTFPSIKFDDDGVCNYCHSFDRQENLTEQRTKHRAKFESLFEERKNKGDYDCLMCYSGGKDSTYTLHILKKTYNARILAVTMDNGFVSEKAFKNIQKVVESLNIDHYLIKPRFDVLKKIFVTCCSENLYSEKSLERASSICTSCMGLVKFISLRLAIEKNIPFITYGWSPGQAPIASSVFKNNPSMVRTMQNAIKNPMSKIVGDLINPYFLEEKHFDLPENFPYNVNPLAFLDYNESNIFNEIGKLGWEAPKDTDANSTNCLMNAFANVVHKSRLHFHPYAFEIAGLVRENVITREEGIERINKQEDLSIVEMVKNRLGIS